MALVADDDIELRDAMTAILETNGFTVLPASNGDETVEKALSHHVDIVLVDQSMPKRSGAEVQRALREAGFTQPVIIVSGFSEIDGLSANHLKKPFAAEELLSAVRQTLADNMVEALASRKAASVSEATAADHEVGRQIGAGPVTGDSRPLVLIVDDSRSNHRALAEGLQSDFRTASAFDGLEGLMLAAQLVPDLIIVDDRLPPVSGEEMIRQIRARAELSQTPILVLAEDTSQVARLLENDVQDLARKPLLLAEVRARSARLLTARRTHDALTEAAGGRRDPDTERLAGDLLRRRKTDEVRVQSAHESQGIAELENRVKSGFLRMMAHEIKTPITAMRLQMRLLERALADIRAPGVQDGMDRIAQSSNRLLQLIDTCIEWARVESKRFRAEIAVFDLVRLVADGIAEFEDHVQRKGIGVEFVAPDALPSLSSDRKLVRLAFLNLINFAVQSTEKGTIRVSVDSHGSCQRVWITDAGPPIAEPEQLFSPFRSDVDLTWRVGSGSGLGLYVVRDLARALHGDVVLHSTTRKGNTFVLAIPRRAEQGCG